MILGWNRAVFAFRRCQEPHALEELIVQAIGRHVNRAVCHETYLHALCDTIGSAIVKS